jgi:hypothetical protein
LEYRCKVLEEIGWRGIDWISLAEDSGQWMAVVSTTIDRHSILEILSMRID